MILVAFAWCLACVPQVWAQEEDPGKEELYIDARDREIADLAKDAAEARCSNGFIKHVPTGGREDLEAYLGGENVVLKVMAAAESPSHASTAFVEQVNFQWLVLKSTTLVVGLVMFFAYWCVCWSLVPWVHCCRLCATPSKAPFLLQFCLWVIMFSCLTGLTLVALTTKAGFDQCTAGFENSACSTATLLDISLSGQPGEEGGFLGLLPAMESLEALEEQFKPGSAFRTGAMATVNSTVELDDAVQVLSGVLSLLGSTAINTRNLRPIDEMEGDFLHDCRLCEAVDLAVQQADSALSGSLGYALAAARSEAQVQLSETHAARSRDLEDSLRAIQEFKGGVRDVFGAFLEPGPFLSLKEHSSTTLMYLTYAFIIHGTFLVGVGMLATGCLNVRRECCYSAPHRLACCAWECGFTFLIPVFIVGGLLQALAVPLSGTCMMLQDLDASLLHDISGSLGVNMSADQGIMVGELVDRCLMNTTGNLTDEKGSNMMDVLYIRDADTGSATFLRERLVDEVLDPIEDSFARVSEILEAPTSDLVNSPQFELLGRLLRENPVAGLLLPDEQAMQQDPALQDLALVEDLAVAFQSSSACQDHNVSNVPGILNGGEIPGLTTFLDALGGIGDVRGVDPSDPTCIQNVSVVCAVGSSTQARACNAAKAYVKVKQELATEAVFRCDLFEDEEGFLCDPFKMAQGYGSHWSEDCLRRDLGEERRFVVRERFCDLQEFSTYVQEFDVRLSRAVSRLDVATRQTTEAINVDLRSYMQEHVVARIQGLVEGSDCSFMQPLYQDVIDTVCYQGVWGLRLLGDSYAWCAYLMCILEVVMYTFWRTSMKKEPGLAPADIPVPPSSAAPQQTAADGGAAAGEPALVQDGP